MCILIKFFVSFHEMGIYDIPAMILYITKMTSQPLHAYIGHSLGSTASYVMAAERPEFARMVRIIISLAPAAIVKRTTTPLRFIASLLVNNQVKNHMKILSKIIYYQGII